MTRRRVVLTADDFGYDRASGELVLELLRERAVTATTVIAASDCLPDLAPGLGAATGAGLGLHVVTNSDAGREPWRALSPEGRAAWHRGARAEPAPASSAALPEDPLDAEERCTPVAAVAEMEAQLARLEEFGLRPARMDSHCGTMYGLHGNGFLPEAIGICARRGMGLRLPRVLEPYLGEGVPDPVRGLHARAVAGADAAGVPLPAAMATSTTPRAEIGSYGQLRDEYIALLARLPEGTSEVFLHPGADTAWARTRFGADWDKRVWEARLLRDPAWRRALEREEIDLVDRW
jgi:hypothetical protein